jgi:N-acetyl-gamma-glutamyl-phosphate reductase
VDVCFSCLPSGKLAETLPAVRAELVVDLSDDHRADVAWAYGLTEFARDEIAESRRVANPGCYPTAVLLAIVPFARAGLLEGPVLVDAMSGVSGAGRRVEDRLLFGSVDGSVSAYGSVSHRHIPEMERGLASFAGTDVPVSFTPHLVPLSRGLLATVRVQLARALDDAAALGILADAYEGERFVRVVEGWPATKPVAGSNGALVSARVDGKTGFLIASCAIDNLGKGAAGQALQNANLALGLDENLGLEPFGVWP